MAPNAARKLAPREHGTILPPDNSGEITTSEIKQKKDLNKQEIARVFDAVKDRAKSKSGEVEGMQNELMDLINKIPDKDDGNYLNRLHNFGVRFKQVKIHLDNLLSEEGLEGLPLETVAPTKESSERFHHTDVNGSKLNGKLITSANGEKVFSGDITLSNKDHFSGLAVEKADGSYVFQGDGILEKHDGVKLDGFFENGALLDGHITQRLKDGQTQFQTINNGNITKIEVGKFDSKHNLSGVGIREDKVLHIKEQGEFVNGKLVDGFVIDSQSGKSKTRLKDGKEVPIGESLPTKVLTAEEKLSKMSKNIIERVTKTDGLTNFPDINGRILNGKLVHNSSGEHIFTGKINYKHAGRTIEFNGHAVLDNEGAFHFDGADGVLTIDEHGNKTIEKGDYKNGYLMQGTRTEVGKNVRYENAIKMVAKVEDGQELDRVFDLQNIEDKNDVEFSGQLFEKEDKDIFVGDFTMPNGTIYRGEAIKNKKGNFELIKGKTEMIKAATVIDKFRKFFGGKKKEANVPAVAVKIEEQSEDLTSSLTEAELPKLPEVQIVPEDFEEKDFEFINADDDVVTIKTKGTFGTEEADGSRIFAGDIKIFTEGSGESEYIGSAKFFKDNRVVFQGQGKSIDNYRIMEGEWDNSILIDGEVRSKKGKVLERFVNGESVPVEAEPKEKGWMGKTADVVFTKEGGRIINQTAYKTVTSILGVKLGTDVCLAVAAGALNKVSESRLVPERMKKRVKEEAAAAGSYSDVYKYWVGNEQVAEIKKSFAEFLESQKPDLSAEVGKELDLNVVGEKYATLKAKIESADQINPEAKAKFLLKLEKLKQDFDINNKELDEEESMAAIKTVDAFVVNNTSVLQIWRDGINGLAKLYMVASTVGTAGAAVPVTAAALATKAAIGRVAGMAITKVAERVQKNKIYNEQMKIDQEREVVGTMKDFKFALLETMHGISGGIFNEGKNVKTGKQLNGKERLANFAKSWGNIFVATGVVFAVQGKTIGEVVGSLFHKADEVKDATLLPTWMQKVHDTAHPKVAGVGVAHGHAAGHAPGHPKMPVRGISPEHAKAGVAVAGAAATSHLAENGEAGAAGHVVAEQAATAEAGQAPSGDVLAIQDISKVHNFATFEHEMLKAMKFEFVGKDIHHMYRFHPGAKIEFVGADDKPVYTYEVPKGGSAAGAIEELHHKHPELFKNKEGWGQIKGVRLVDTGDAKHPTIEVPKHVIIESHDKGGVHFRKGEANLERPVSSDKIVIDTHEKPGRVQVGPNIKAAVPKGWEVHSDKQGLTTSMVDARSGHTLIPVYEASNVMHDDLVSPDKTHWVDVTTSEVYDASGQHINNLNFVKKPSGISWGQGGAIGDKQRVELAGHIIHQPEGKAVPTETIAKAEKPHHAGGAVKEKGTVLHGKGHKLEAKPTATKVEKVAAPAESHAPGRVESVVEVPPVHEITTLEAGREAIANLEYLNATEKMRLKNLSYLLQWQHDLYGKDGSNIRVALKGHDFGVLGNEEIKGQLGLLAHRQESATKDFMKAIQEKQPLSAITEKISDDALGYSDLKDSDMATKIFDSNLSDDLTKNSVEFKAMETERIGKMFDQISRERFLEISDRE